MQELYNIFRKHWAVFENAGPPDQVQEDGYSAGALEDAADGQDLETALNEADTVSEANATELDAESVVDLDSQPVDPEFLMDSQPVPENPPELGTPGSKDGKTEPEIVEDSVVTPSPKTIEKSRDMPPPPVPTRRVANFGICDNQFASAPNS